MASPFTPASSRGGGGGGGVVEQGTNPWVVATPDTQPISGSVEVSNLPPTQPISGSVEVSNLPPTQPISAAALPLPASAARDETLTDGSQRVGGTVAISAASLPLPATAATDRATAASPAATRLSDGATFYKATTPADTQPVSGTVSATQGSTPWKAREDTAAMTWASLKSAAPSASAVQADTGALAAGDYDFDVELLVADTAAVGKGLVVEHRNAANNATLQTLGGCAAPGQLELRLRRYTMATNERLRVIAGTAAGAASSMYVSAVGRRVS